MCHPSPFCGLTQPSPFYNLLAYSHFWAVFAFRSLSTRHRLWQHLTFQSLPTHDYLWQLSLFHSLLPLSADCSSFLHMVVRVSSQPFYNLLAPRNLRKIDPHTEPRLQQILHGIKVFHWHAAAKQPCKRHPIARDILKL